MPAVGDLRDDMRQSQFAAGAEITVPLGGAATGVFKVDGCLATSGLRTAWRKG